MPRKKKTEVVEETPFIKEAPVVEVVPETKKYFVNSDRPLNLRAYPSLQAKVSKVLKNETELQVEEYDKSSNWTKVTAEGITGYVMTRFIIEK